MSTLADWINPELNYDAKDRPLISDMDEVLSYYKPESSAVWLFVGDTLFSLAKPGRKIELSVLFHPDKAGLQGVESDSDFAHFIENNHKYDGELQGLTLTAPTLNDREVVRDYSFGNRYAAMHALYENVSTYAERPTWDPVESDDGVALMVRLDERLNPQEQAFFSLSTTLRPGMKCMGFTRGDQHVLFRQNSLHPVGHERTKPSTCVRS